MQGFPAWFGDLYRNFRYGFVMIPEIPVSKLTHGENRRAELRASVPHPLLQLLEEIQDDVKLSDPHRAGSRCAVSWTSYGHPPGPQRQLPRDSVMAGDPTDGLPVSDPPIHTSPWLIRASHPLWPPSALFTSGP